MAKSMAEYHRWLADQIEADEKAERDAEAAEKLDKLEASALSDEDRELLAWAREMRAKLAEEDEEDEAADDEAKKRKAKAKKVEPPAEEEKPPAKTRPGRKSGAAYDWWVGDDGQVVKLDTARIYDGPDEDEAVPLPNEPAEEAA